MRHKVACILPFLEGLLIFSTAVPPEVTTLETEESRFSNSVKGLKEDFFQADENFVTDFPEKLKDKDADAPLENSIPGINEHDEELLDDNEFLQFYMQEEQTNFLDIVAQQIFTLDQRKRTIKKPHPSMDCGGTLEPADSGVITYKEDENYDKLEHCFWIVEVPNATIIEFTLEKCGYQDSCAGVNIITLDDPKANSTYLIYTLLAANQRTTFVKGSIALVKFTSYNSTQGFRLRFQNFDTRNKDGMCGGVIIRKTGFFSYKLRRNSLHNEHCVWLIHSPYATSIELNLVQDGFESVGDYIVVNTIDPDTGTIRNNTQIMNSNNWYRKIEAPLVIIVYRSDERTPGKGFLLQFHSTDTEFNPKYKYKLQHTTGFSGTVEYPNEQENWDGGTRGERDIFVIASSGITSFEKYITHIDWKIQQANYSCMNAYLAIYLATYMGSQHMWLHTEFKNRDGLHCYDDDRLLLEDTNMVSLNGQPFIIVYKSGSDDQNGNGSLFKFHYYRKVYGYFSVLPPLRSEFGVISYKENEHYTNYEYSTWLVKVPGAAGIRFILEINGFERCRDYVTVFPIDATTGKSDEGDGKVLGCQNQNATVKGSRAVVSFTSDRIVTGTGFRLRYENTTSFLAVEDITCGGVIEKIEDDFGIITYKENEMYVNNKLCIWLIQVPNMTRILFTLEKNGFQSCCDYITVISAEANGTMGSLPLELRYSSQTVVAFGSNVTVTFKSDSIVAGRGFRLRFQKLPDSETISEDDKCGGVIVKTSGVLSYKSGRQYLNNEVCVWLLHVPKSKTVKLKLLQSGFEERHDYILAYSVDPETGSMELHGIFDKYTVNFVKKVIFGQHRVYLSNDDNRGQHCFVLSC